MNQKGFYMIIDVSIAASLTLMIVIMLIASYMNMPGSGMTRLCNYKKAESALYSMKYAGEINAIAYWLDQGNYIAASTIARNALTSNNIGLNSKLVLKAYGENMTLLHSFESQSGPLGKNRIAVSLPMRVNSTLSKYVTAVLEVET